MKITEAHLKKSKKKIDWKVVVLSAILILISTYNIIILTNKDHMAKQVKKEELVIGTIHSKNSNLICVEVQYGTKKSLDADDESTKFYEVIVGNENYPDIPEHKKFGAGDLIKFNARFQTQETWIDGKIYNVCDFNSVWFSINKNDVKGNLITRKR